MSNMAVFLVVSTAALSIPQRLHYYVYTIRRRRIHILMATAQSHQYVNVETGEPRIDSFYIESAQES